MINVEMKKSSGVTLATENTICNENVKVTIANAENLIPDNIKKDVQIADVIGTLESGGGDDTALIGLIQRDMTEIVIPDGVTSIGSDAFSYCSKLTDVTISNSITSIGSSAFSHCSSLTSITIPNSVTSIGNDAFWNCSSLTSITIPNSITRIGGGVFWNCSSLTSVELAQGFNAYNLNLSASTLYTAETIVSWLEALADRTGQSTYKLTIGSTNIAKLTEAEIAIATNKNWTLA